MSLVCLRGDPVIHFQALYTSLYFAVYFSTLVNKEFLSFSLFSLWFSHITCRVEQSKYLLELQFLMLPAKTVPITRQLIIRNILSNLHTINNNMNTLKLPSLVTIILGWTPMKLSSHTKITTSKSMMLKARLYFNPLIY